MTKDRKKSQTGISKQSKTKHTGTSPKSTDESPSSIVSSDALISPKLKRKYNFQRASIACEKCRKAKTRCNYLNDGSSCFRCENLSLKCSLHDSQAEPVMSKFQENTSIKSRDDVGTRSEQRKRRRTKVQSVSLVDNSTVESSSVKSDFHEDSVFSNSSSGSIDNSTSLSLLHSKLDSIAQTLNTMSYSNNGGRPNNNEMGYIGASGSLVQPYNNMNNMNNMNNKVGHVLHQNSQNNSFLKMYPQSTSLMNHSSSGITSSINLMGLLPNSNSRNSSSNGSPMVIAPLARPLLQPSTRLFPSQFSTTTQIRNTTTTGNQLGNSPSGHENDEFFFLNAPYLDVMNIASNFGLPFSKEIGFDITRDAVLLSIQERYDLINRNILDYQTCFSLIEIALLHYGKWITYVENDFKLWFDIVRSSSPLLFCTLVLFGLRHHRLNHSNKSLELDILQSIHQLLSLSVYEVPQSKEFLQTIILLTHFSPSLSYQHIYFDSWWVSSYGLIHFMTREMTMNLLVKNVKSPDKIHQYRIWNHLTISHLINCILSGRPCLIDDPRLDQCRDILELSEVTSFDAIIVAEICLMLSLYNSLQYPEKIEVALKDLESTYSDWKYLTESVAPGKAITAFYFFAKLMILRRFILKNLHMKGDVEHSSRCEEFYHTFNTFSDFIKLIDLSDSSDLLKQCVFLCVFMTLQFRQLDLFDNKNDFQLKKGVDNYLELSSIMESKIFCYNGYFNHYSELIIRMKDSVFQQSHSHNKNKNTNHRQ